MIESGELTKVMTKWGIYDDAYFSNGPSCKATGPQPVGIDNVPIGFLVLFLFGLSLVVFTVEKIVWLKKYRRSKSPIDCQD